MQKIAVCGKGGSGKSTLARLLANGLIRRGNRVVLIDSDESNTGLHRMMGFSEPPGSLVDYLGGKQKVEETITARIRSGVPENMVSVMQRKLTVDELPPAYVLEKDGIQFVMVGKILMALEGCACPMGIVSRSFLRDLVLKPGQVAVIDMEAGVEHFGRGVETSVDCVLAVVEPSLDSLEIAGKIGELSRQINIGDVWAVLNKAPSQDIVEELTVELKNRGLTVIGSIPNSRDVFNSCLKGTPLAADALSVEMDKITDFLFP
jgi:CO dehydrogenase maturation factor